MVIERRLFSDEYSVSDGTPLWSNHKLFFLFRGLQLMWMVALAASSALIVHILFPVYSTLAFAYWERAISFKD